MMNITIENATVYCNNHHVCGWMSLCCRTIKRQYRRTPKSAFEKLENVVSSQ